MIEVYFTEYWKTAQNETETQDFAAQSGELVVCGFDWMFVDLVKIVTGIGEHSCKGHRKDRLVNFVEHDIICWEREKRRKERELAPPPPPGMRSLVDKILNSPITQKLNGRPML